MRSLQLLLLHSSALLVVSTVLDCTHVLTCDVDPQKVKEAIDMIPDPGLLPEDHPLGAGAYRIPAIFEASRDAQVLVRISSASGLVLDPDTLMTYLWPNAKQAAKTIYDKCDVETTGMSGAMHPKITWENPTRKLGFQVDVMCRIDKSLVSGVTTYTPGGIEAGARIGEGRNHTGWGHYGS